MAWSSSEIFSAFITDILMNTTAMDLGGTPDTFNAGLHGTSTTPVQDAASAATAYNTGAWATDKLTDTGSSAPAGWPTVGRPLVSPATTFSSNVITFDAVDTVSANAVTTITAAFGTLIYDDTIATPVAKQAVCLSQQVGIHLNSGQDNPQVVKGTSPIVIKKHIMYSTYTKGEAHEQRYSRRKLEADERPC